MREHGLPYFPFWKITAPRQEDVDGYVEGLWRSRVRARDLLERKETMDVDYVPWFLRSNHIESGRFLFDGLLRRLP